MDLDTSKYSKTLETLPLLTKTLGSGLGSGLCDLEGATSLARFPCIK